MSESHEKKLWKGLQLGKMDSLGRLYDLYVDELFAFGMSISADKFEVLDGIHDLYLNLYKYHSKLDDAANIKAYLFRSLKRALHKKSGNKIVPIENAEDLGRLAKNEENSQSHESQIIAIEQSTIIREKLNRAMNMLTQNQQKVLLMRFQEDKSYEEIAESISVSIASARTIIYRAIKILRGGVLILLFALS